MVAFCAIHVLASQYILAERSKGDVLIFQTRPLSQQQVSKPGLEEGNKEPTMTFAQDINKLRSTQYDACDEMTDLDTPKQSVMFEWNDLCYDVATKNGTKRILNGITGWVKPGTMTALMVRERLHLPLSSVPSRVSGGPFSATSVQRFHEN